MTTTQKEEFFPIQSAQKKEPTTKISSFFLRCVDKKDSDYTVRSSFSIFAPFLASMPDSTRFFIAPARQST